MRNFSNLENWVRKHFIIYRIIRRAAPFICRFITLEDGFEILKYIKPKDYNFSILDVGANDGTSIRMIRQFQKAARIIAFDPITKPKFDLRNVDFREYALGNVKNHFSLYTPVVHGVPLTQYSSLHSEKLRTQVEHDLGISESDYGIVEKSVEVRLLDSLTLTPFFIKIDVEGAEVAVIEGAKETLKHFQPIILVEIQSQESYDLISKYMVEQNYVCISLKPHKNLSSSNISHNFQHRYISSQNNYVWIPNTTSSSWIFNR
jgi:FkbM family methyltransferase